MGKAKRATRKELEDVITEMIARIQELEMFCRTFNSYVGHYIDWKGDRDKFDNFFKGILLKEKENDGTLKSNGNIKEDNSKKVEKQSRYKKITQPL